MEYFMKLMGIVNTAKKANAKPGQIVPTFSSLLGLEILCGKITDGSITYTARFQQLVRCAPPVKSAN